MIDRLFGLSALALPIVYFGMQMALAPFFPGYDFVRNPTSLLGIDGAVTAPWFNALAILCGALTFVTAGGTARSLARADANRMIVLLVGLSLFAVGCGNVWAGVFPLPDPRHGDNPFNLAFDAVPIVLALAASLTASLRSLRAYLVLNLIFWAIIKSVFGGLTPIDPATCLGILQRLAAATIFVPIGVAGWALSRQSVSTAR